MCGRKRGATSKPKGARCLLIPILSRCSAKESIERANNLLPQLLDLKYMRSPTGIFPLAFIQVLLGVFVCREGRAASNRSPESATYNTNLHPVSMLLAGTAISAIQIYRCGFFRLFGTLAIGIASQAWSSGSKRILRSRVFFQRHHGISRRWHSVPFQLAALIICVISWRQTGWEK